MYKFLRELIFQLSATVAAEEKANEIIGTAPLRALEYDFDTFRKLGELGRLPMHI